MDVKENNLQGTKEIKATAVPLLKSSKTEYTAASILGAIKCCSLILCSDFT